MEFSYLETPTNQDSLWIETKSLLQRIFPISIPCYIFCLHGIISEEIAETLVTPTYEHSSCARPLLQGLSCAFFQLTLMVSLAGSPQSSTQLCPWLSKLILRHILSYSLHCNLFSTPRIFFPDSRHLSIYSFCLESCSSVKSLSTFRSQFQVSLPRGCLSSPLAYRG